MFKEICIMSDVDMGEVSPKFQVFFFHILGITKTIGRSGIIFFLNKWEIFKKCKYKVCVALSLHQKYLYLHNESFLCSVISKLLKPQLTPTNSGSRWVLHLIKEYLVSYGKVFKCFLKKTTVNGFVMARQIHKYELT